MMRIAYVLGTFPKLSETFILREIQEIERHGVAIELLSLERPKEDLPSELAALAARTTYAPAALELLTGGARVRQYRQSLESNPRSSKGFLGNLKTERWIQVAAHFAEHLAPKEIDRIHAHFAGVPALVGAASAEMLELPFSFSAHANDVFCGHEFIEWKMERAGFVSICNEAAQAHFLSLIPENLRDKVHLVHHGLPIADYEFVAELERQPVSVLSVGRLESKKGFDDLVRASRRLRNDGLEVRVKIIGEGSQGAALESLIEDLDMEGTIRLMGAVSHEKVIEQMRTSTIFALASRETPDGDRDGIPNVLLEAAAVGLPIVATDAGSIPEFVNHDATGCLVPQNSPDALADALATLVSDAELQNRLRRKARQKVETEFEITNQTGQLLSLFASAD
ncbi:MAG: glycosyltransferase [Planctomycetota bacterium]|jgi:glycosyltransferase involved in cell wall biosynthesis|nr:glycosyltransferase [Planctomycetota bacterium]